MKFLTNIKWRKLLRSIHRDLGYLFVGLTCIYGISGIILNHSVEGKDPAFKEIIIQKQIAEHLSSQKLKEIWNTSFPQLPSLTHVIPAQNNFRLYVEGGMGEYTPENGTIEIKIYKERPLVKFMNSIHYNQGKRFTWLANFFALSLVFFAISGIIIVKGKKGFKKRGIWFMLIGLIIPIILYFL